MQWSSNRTEHIFDSLSFESGLRGRECPPNGTAEFRNLGSPLDILRSLFEEPSQLL